MSDPMIHAIIVNEGVSVNDETTFQAQCVDAQCSWEGAKHYSGTYWDREDSHPDDLAWGAAYREGQNHLQMVLVCIGGTAHV